MLFGFFPFYFWFFIIFFSLLLRLGFTLNRRVSFFIALISFIVYHSLWIEAWPKEFHTILSLLLLFRCIHSIILIVFIYIVVVFLSFWIISFFTTIDKLYECFEVLFYFQFIFDIIFFFTQLLLPYCEDCSGCGWVVCRMVVFISIGNVSSIQLFSLYEIILRIAY